MTDDYGVWITSISEEVKLMTLKLQEHLQTDPKRLFHNGTITALTFLTSMCNFMFKAKSLRGVKRVRQCDLRLCSCLYYY